MSEEKKTPFEQAAYNVKVFAENADMMQSLSRIKKLLSEIETFEEKEQEMAIGFVDAAIISLSKFLEERGDEWN